MTPFTDAARREGRKAMEDSLTKAKRVARKLAGGRKPKESENAENLSKKVAALKAMTYREAAKAALDEYGLTPEDLRIHLVYTDGHTAKPIRISDDLPELFERLDKLEEGKVLFLGVIGELQDREADNVILRWVRPFLATPLAVSTLTSLRDGNRTEFLN